MEYNLPHRISSEKDLKYYEQYIGSESKLLNTNCSKALSCESENPKNQKIKVIENKLLNSEMNKAQNRLYWNDYLKNHIGKLVRVESLVCERLESRIGILLAVGNDYIVIKPNRNCCSMMIGSQSIQYITIIHNNIGISR